MLEACVDCCWLVNSVVLVVVYIWRLVIYFMVVYCAWFGYFVFVILDCMCCCLVVCGFCLCVYLLFIVCYLFI